MTNQGDHGRSKFSQDDAAISAAVQALLHARGESVSDLAFHVRISVASIYRKLGGQATWRAHDVGAIARHFGVTPGDLYSPAPIVPKQRDRRRTPTRSDAAPGGQERRMLSSAA